MRRTASRLLMAAALVIGATPDAEAQRPVPGERPAITAVSERTLQLKPGGEESKLVLGGSGLVVFTEAVLELDGRPLRDVRIEVQHDRSGGGLMLGLFAGPEVAAAVSRGGTLQIVLLAGRDRLPVEDLAVEVAAPEEREERLPPVEVVPFHPVDLTTGPITLTGLRFRPIDMTIGSMTLTGLRFRAVDMTVGSMTLTGLRFRPVDMTIGSMTLTGLRFRPVDITTETMRLTGIGGSR